MASELHKFDIFYTELIKKSSLTPRQLSIIYNRVQKQKFDSNITSGAYYRQVKQCKSKIRRTLYTILLLYLINCLEENTFTTLEKLLSQLSVIYSDKNLKIQDKDVINVMKTIDDILNMLTRM